MVELVVLVAVAVQVQQLVEQELQVQFKARLAVMVALQTLQRFTQVAVAVEQVKMAPMVQM
jgi:hypothetical protein